jgi:hypothetical protein
MNGIWTGLWNLRTTVDPLKSITINFTRPNLPLVPLFGSDGG